jgi:acetylornithine/succinyldiaminopimelate/putrescine aminotransferase
LAKRATGRTQIIAFKDSYHGSTQGALSIIGDEYWRNAFRPLLPDILHLEYNSLDSLESITGRTACVIAETVQAEKGIHAPSPGWMQSLRKKCSEMGALLILDEIQAGFGRTGSMWGFTQFGIEPDILLLGKALGGGMPLGAFITGIDRMRLLTENPVLGHITTFGGHPVSCAAGLAAMKSLLKEGWIDQVRAKEQLFRDLLAGSSLKAFRSAGLWIALEFENFEANQKAIDRCIQAGALTDWFLFAPHCMRISPPLTISFEEIRFACKLILEALAP